jgi:hypothetical protein
MAEPDLTDLLNSARRALSCLETPGDLTEDERRYVIEDLTEALAPYEPSEEQA